MSKIFVFDFVEKQIVGSKKALRIAGSNTESPEYKALVKMMASQPTFAVVAREPKSNKHKKTYKNLTMETMEKYIKTQPNAEKRLVDFETVKHLAKLKNGLYPITKQWFLTTYPEYKNSGVTQSEIEEMTDSEKSKMLSFPKAANEN